MHYQMESNKIIKGRSSALNLQLTRLAIFNDIGFSEWNSKCDMAQYAIFNCHSNGTNIWNGADQNGETQLFLHHKKVERIFADKEAICIRFNG